MKKLLLTASILIVGYAFYSQTTVLSSNFASIGDQVINTRDSTTIYPVLASGTNLVWDFSTLLDQKRDTFNFVDPTTTTYGSNYPSSTISFDATPSNTAYVLKNSSIAEIVGLTQNTVTGTFSDNQTFVNFPVNYNNIETDTYQYELKGTGAEFDQPAADSGRIRVTGSLKRTVDAWGLLTTPLGSFNVLRMNDTVYETTQVDAIFGGGPWFPVNTDVDTTYSHSFVSDDGNSKYILLSYKLNPNGTMNPDIDWSYITPNTTEVEELDLNVSIFPNPTSELISINTKYDMISIDLYDVNGKLILSKHNNLKSLNVSSLMKGNYYVKINTVNGIITKQFTKE